MFLKFLAEFKEIVPAQMDTTLILIQVGVFNYYRIVVYVNPIKICSVIAVDRIKVNAYALTVII